MLAKFEKLVGKKCAPDPKCPNIWKPIDAPDSNNNIPNDDPAQVPAKGSTKSYRNFCFTVYEDWRWEKIFDYLKHKKNCKYIIAGREICPKTNKKHYQCYCNFSKPTKLSHAKMMNVHIEQCYGTPEENINYCSKQDKNPIIWGEPPTSFKVKTIKEMKNLDDNELDNMPPMYYNIIEKYKQQRQNRLTLDDLDYKKSKVVYIWGEPDMGKTNYAKCLIKRYMIINRIEEYNNVKFTNDFWIGTTKDCKVALYDDFRDSHMKVSEFINFIDYNPHIMNIKGDNMKNSYEYIVITSVQNPEFIYEYMQVRDSEPKKQWMRRIEIINLKFKFKREEYENLLIKELKDDYNIEYDGKKNVKYPDELENINEDVQNYNKSESTAPKKDDEKIDKEMEEIMKNVDINDFIDDECEDDEEVVDINKK